MKTLICGLGSIGIRHLNNLKALGFEDISLLRTGKSQIPDVDLHLKNYKTFTDLDSALDNPFDICVISNPSNLHIEYAVKVASNGINLFVEKPLATSLAGLNHLKEIVSGQDTKNIVTYQFLFHPHINFLKNIFSEPDSKYGKPLYFHCEWSEYLPNWHPWEDYKTGYSALREKGGGVFFTQVHPFNYCEYIFGNLEIESLRLSNSGSLGIEVEEIADILVNNKELSGNIHVDFLAQPRTHSLKVLTTEGSFLWDYHKNNLIFIDKNGIESELMKNNKFQRNDMFIDMTKDFVSSIRENKQPRFTLEKGIDEIIKLINARESYDKV